MLWQNGGGVKLGAGVPLACFDAGGLVISEALPSLETKDSMETDRGLIYIQHRPQSVKIWKDNRLQPFDFPGRPSVVFDLYIDSRGCGVVFGEDAGKFVLRAFSPTTFIEAPAEIPRAHHYVEDYAYGRALIRVKGDPIRYYILASPL